MTDECRKMLRGPFEMRQSKISMRRLSDHLVLRRLRKEQVNKGHRMKHFPYGVSVITYTLRHF